MNIKTLLFQVCLVLMPLTSIAQTSTVNFGYDHNGNRITRQLVFEELLAMRPQVIEEKIAQYDDNILETLDVKLFPNPTYGKFHLEVSGNYGDVTITAVLLTSSGSVITAKEVNVGQLEFDISNQADGVYVLQLSLKNEMRVWKIIKE